MFETKEYLEDEIILAQGELGKGFCILEEGSVEIIRDDLVLNEIDQKGAIFGELSEILMYKRGAAVRAKTNARVRHYTDDLETLVEQNPKFALKLIRNLGRRLYHMNNIAIEGNAKNNIFRNASDSTAIEGQADGIRILVVEEKPYIISQLTDVFSRNSWQVESASDEASALRACESKTYSAIIISISLASNATIELRRKLKTTPSAAKTPIIGMGVKGDEASMTKATNAGFSNFIEKPINANSASSMMYKILKLDPSDQYFDLMDDILYFKVPAFISPFVAKDIMENIEPRIRKTINEGIQKVVVDVSELDEIGEDAIELVGELGEKIEDMELGMQGAFVAHGEDSEMWKNLDGCEEWVICENIDAARTALANPTTAVDD
jgi:CRP-like cAMP-binding protein